MSQVAKLRTPLAAGDFAAFFRALYKRPPFRWQQRLATQVCTGHWPEYIKLPTSSGKTAVIDIAVFALAFQAAKENRPATGRNAPRRIFFVVDRRIIVNEAYRRTLAMATRLNDVLATHRVTPHVDEDEAILVRVAQWLQSLTGNPSAPPLDCFELRGGIYRDDAWIRSPLQPTVLTSTVDQVGSRLLFRGYGSSNRNLPIHAALTANDSLIVLDEAHCSGPFSETMQTIGRYCGEGWSQLRAANPLQFVQMTATPPQIAAKSVFELQESDYTSDPALAQRHRCTKPIRLVEAPGAKGKKLPEALARKLVEQAIQLAADGTRQKIAIVVNRVAVARAAFALLQQKYAERVSLMIGRMRPLDRERLTHDLQRQFGSRLDADHEASPDEPREPRFLVATQCVEVGADLDFDGMVCQCASFDALRQRFGRLNRLGQAPNAAGVIVGAEEDVSSPDKLDDTKPRDPIYGNALARTWHWLNQQATRDRESDGNAAAATIDFGVEALERLTQLAAPPDGIDSLFAPASHAPVLMPAHVDMLCQTSPRPSLEPDIDAYLHGVGRKGADVQICWRADFDLSDLLNGSSLNAWVATVDACPPSSAECLSVPLHFFRQWLRGETTSGDSGDVLGEQVLAEDSKLATRADRTVLVWRGSRTEPDAAEASFLANSSNDRRLRPGDTIVIPAEFGGWKTLGYIPNAPSDPAEPADCGDFTTTDPVQLHRLLLRNGDLETGASESASERWLEQTPETIALAQIDVADEAFLQAQGKTRWRIHPKLKPASELHSIWKALLKAANDPDSDLSASQWRAKAVDLFATVDTGTTPSDGPTAGLLQRLAESTGEPEGGRLTRYPGGVIWVTPRNPLCKLGVLPLSTFGDNEDSLSMTGRVTLAQHSADVMAEIQRLCDNLDVPRDLSATLRVAAQLHDLGKADPRFQAMLTGKPLHIAYMLPRLWAKSTDGRPQRGLLPDSYRHEMISLALMDRFQIAEEPVDEALLKHVIAAHHGYGRPFAPVCIDPSPPGINLREFGGGTVSAEERASWVAAHRLDAGISERFWILNRRYGWWGAAYLESLLRLADWQASASPRRSDSEFTLAARPQRLSTYDDVEPQKTLTLGGIDGSNPLGFLAALGAFRILSSGDLNNSLRLKWTKIEGAWRPQLCAVGNVDFCEESVVKRLDQALRESSSEHPALVTSQEAERFGYRNAFLKSSSIAQASNRDAADWLSCNGSDTTGPEAISQLQTTRRDYHAINIRGLLKQTTAEHLRRSLFHAWDYADPVAGVSLHLEPREDRRHAYQWHMPSGDPTRSNSGGMIGANRLALEAWPLFQSLPDGDRLKTAGFRGNRITNTSLIWPIWHVPIDLETLRSVLVAPDLLNDESKLQDYLELGISVVYRCRRILVGKTPNLTSSIAALA